MYYVLLKQGSIKLKYQIIRHWKPYSEYGNENNW